MENMDLKWYVIHTNSGYESVVLENLKKIVFYHLYDFIVSKNLNIKSLCRSKRIS